MNNNRIWFRMFHLIFLTMAYLSLFIGGDFSNPILMWAIGAYTFTNFYGLIEIIDELQAEKEVTWKKKKNQA